MHSHSVHRVYKTKQVAVPDRNRTFPNMENKAEIAAIRTDADHRHSFDALAKIKEDH